MERQRSDEQVRIPSDSILLEGTLTVPAALKVSCSSRMEAAAAG